MLGLVMMVMEAKVRLQEEEKEIRVTDQKKGKKKEEEKALGKIGSETFLLYRLKGNKIMKF